MEIDEGEIHEDLLKDEHEHMFTEKQVQSYKEFSKDP
jgi:hypothetical protein